MVEWQGKIYCRVARGNLLMIYLAGKNVNQVYHLLVIIVGNIVTLSLLTPVRLIPARYYWYVFPHLYRANRYGWDGYM